MLACLLALLASRDHAGRAVADVPDVALTPVGTFASPVFVTSPPGDPTRLFVVSRSGTVHVVKNGVTLPASFPGRSPDRPRNRQLGLKPAPASQGQLQAMGSRETLEYIVSWLVEHPDDVRVEEEDSGRTVIYDLFLHPDDVGRVIGRSGRVARAIRSVVKAAAAKEDRNALVEIVD